MFENIRFNGQFRSYQQKVLNSADAYLSDGRIHIVAAPGSGKTVLGLELIRRLNAPCIILSPTTTIRNQWIDRFTENFLGGEDPENYISYDLKNLAPLTSVTYQALHAAMKRIKNDEDGVDYSSIDLIAAIKSYGIKTVCLDEAHHLQSEWQKALESFLEAMDGEIKTLALTATPPYDAKPAEWKRYIGVCGEIDEEIFVPELVKQGTLCPHQDFLYFNYPTSKEAAQFDEYRQRVTEATDELFATDILDKAYARLLEHRKDYDFLYANTAETVAFLALCESIGIKPDKRLVKTLTVSTRLPNLTKERLNVAVNFLPKSTLLSEDECKAYLDIFKRHDLYARGEIELWLNEKLKKELISSLGKLQSIKAITESEYESKKDDLRLLILTDYIKKENISAIGADGDPDTMSVVSIFETVRKTGVSVGALSGSLVMLPNGCAEKLSLQNAQFTVSPLKNCGYSAFDFKANNREKVRLVGQLFEQGIINAIVGTKSLLGEGWDAPYVNSLIIASFVGSFMLSNQMRGRAIRIDKNHPDKTANIWHLVTVERPGIYAEGILGKLSQSTSEDKNQLLSDDYDTVVRRFDCFVAPNYSTGEIESGISRLTVIQPPYDQKGIERINGQMLELSKSGERIRSVWQEQLQSSSSAKLNETTELPKQKRTPPFLFFNFAVAAMLTAAEGAFLAAFVNSIMRCISGTDNIGVYLAAAASVIAFCIIAPYLSSFIISRILAHVNPVRSIRKIAECILKTMQELGLVSNGAHVKVESDQNGIFIETELLSASVHDQNIIHTAMKELLSPIENPRYLLIPHGIFARYRYRYALACPEILGSKNVYAECLAKNLKRYTGKLEAVYTRNETGRQLILKCRRLSYITRNEDIILGRRKRVSRWE